MGTSLYVILNDYEASVKPVAIQFASAGTALFGASEQAGGRTSAAGIGLAVTIRP